MPLKRMLWALLLSVTSLCAACDDPARERSDDSESPSAVADPAGAQRRGNRHGPIATTLSGPQQVAVGALAQLRLQIDRRALHDQVPVEVQLLLPPEVALEQGAERTVVSPSSEASTELRYAVRPLARTRTPLILVIDAHGPGFGYHAELPYYLEGQVQPALAPARAAGEVRVGRRNFGQSVGIEPSAE